MIGLGAPIATPVAAIQQISRARPVCASCDLRHRSTLVDLVGVDCIEAAPSVRGTSDGVEYTVRAARITDVDRFVALCGEQIGDRGSGTALDAADMLRQLVYLPHASILVAERHREIAGGAVLAIRPSVRGGGYVGTIDLLAIAPGADVDAVTEVLVEEALRSAANKGCASIEATRLDDPTERTRWEQRGFIDLGPHMGRALAPAGANRRSR